MAKEQETNSVILLLQHLIEKTDIKDQFFIVITPNFATLAFILLIFLTLSHVIILIHIHTWLWMRNRHVSATETATIAPPVGGGGELVRSNRRESDTASDRGTEQPSPVPVTENDATTQTTTTQSTGQPYYSVATSTPNWPISQAQDRLATANIELISSIRRRAANPIAESFLTADPRFPGPGRSRGSLLALVGQEGTRPGGFGSNRTSVWPSTTGSHYKIPVAGGGSQRNGGERGGETAGVSGQARPGEAEIPASE